MHVHAAPSRAILRYTLILFASVLGSCASVNTRAPIDSFDDPAGWNLVLADGVRATLHNDEGVLRVDYDFTSGSGYCIVRKQVDLDLDPNYRFTLRYKGTGPRNTLEFKLVDDTGDNVWWAVERDYEFPREYETRSIRKRHISFAWGPDDSPLERVRTIEIVVTASQGGIGSLYLDELGYERLPDTEPKPSEPRASSASEDLERVAPDGTLSWSATDTGMLALTFDTPVEFSAITLDWETPPESYTIESSIDADTYLTLAHLTNPNATNIIHAPETEAQQVRIAVQGNATLRAITFAPVERFPGANDYITHLTTHAPRGTYPRSFTELSPWTVTGLPEHHDEALISADGAIEPFKRGPTLEPFVIRNNTVITWADVDITNTLHAPDLPTPDTRWTHDTFTLDIVPLTTDLTESDITLVRYTLTNTTNANQSLTLALAARPFQVLPAAQFLNTVGGAVPVPSARADSDTITINNAPFAMFSEPATSAVVTDVPAAPLVEILTDRARRAPAASIDKAQFASAALLHDLTLKPNASHTIIAALPMNGRATLDAPSVESFARIESHERVRWRELLTTTELILPESHRDLQDTLRANLAYILINADGPGIQPGSRSYERSWIRDGAMTSAALIALGRADDAKRFISWYAPYQYDNGKVPCVVDFRGPDPVDENDAPGEFIFAIRNAVEAGGHIDTALATKLYPNVVRAVDYIEMMRNKRLTPQYTDTTDPIDRACAGLMPESISHEGYSEKPMHSYWDDFWIYRGLWDAARLADELGHDTDRARFEKLATDFGQSLSESIDRATAHHDIDYVPGCVELGDFDATSTAIAYYPTGAASVIDPALLRNTFERAWTSTQGRIAGEPWNDMTPYEVRLVGTFIRLGWRERAHQYLDWLMTLRDPQGWKQWGEIAWEHREPPRFVGDMPHTWVGSGAILSILSIFAYEDQDTIVLGAGIMRGWLNDDQPVGIRDLITRFGPLSYTLTRDADTLTLEIDPGCTPPDGYRLDFAPLMNPTMTPVLPSVTIDGQHVRPDPASPLSIPADARCIVIQR
jgi:hypothetical protein